MMDDQTRVNIERNLAAADAALVRLRDHLADGRVALEREQQERKRQERKRRPWFRIIFH